MFIVLVAVAFLMWQVVKLGVTAWNRLRRRRRPGLSDRLVPDQVPYHPSGPSVADAAQEWLNQQA